MTEELSSSEFKLSQDSSTGNEAEKISALIICQNPSTIRGSITFLNRRGVETIVSESIPDALKILSAKRPRFVLLSANFPHQKLESMPQLLQSNFNVDVIIFSEKTDRRVEARINNMKTKNIIYGQVSGPSILLKIRQILKENEVVEEKETSGTDEKRESRNTENERIKIGGKNATGNPNDPVVLSNREPQPGGNESMQRLMRELGDETDDEFGQSGLKRSGSTFVAKGKPPKKFAVMPDEAKEAKRSGVLKKDPRLKDSPFKSSSEKTKKSSSNERERQEKDEKLHSLEQEQKAAQERELQGAHEAKQRPVLHSATQAQAAELHKKPELSIAPKQVKPEMSATNEAIASKENAAAIGPVRSAALTAPPESLSQSPKSTQLWSCARLALLEVSQGRDVYDMALEDLHSVYLLGISSPTIEASFFLSVAKGKNSPYSAIAQLHERFVHHLRAQGHMIMEKQSEVLELNPSFIKKTGFLGADFTLSAYSPLMEISISFLDIKKVTAKIEPGFKDYAKVSLHDVATDVPVTFNAYIHLPLNNRTIRYLKTGSVFQEPQKERLIKEGTEHFYIRTDEVKTFREHHAQSSVMKQMEKKRNQAS